MTTQNIAFGRFSPDGKVQLLEFCPDPDDSALPWFRETGATVDLAEYREVGSDKMSYRGVCYDTGEYFSHVGLLKQRLLLVAPKGATLMVVEYTSAAGTRTFEEEVRATYYADNTPGTH